MSILTTESGSSGQPSGGTTQAPGNSGTVVSGSQASGQPIKSETPPATSWRDSLPADLKENPLLANFSDVPNLAKSYLSAQQLIGKKGVIVPESGAAQEEWNEFYKKIGRPDVEKYEIKAPEGKTVDPKVLEQWKQATYEAGLLPKQAETLLAKQLEMHEATVKAQFEQLEEEQKEELAGLKKEWGNGFEKKASMAAQLVKQVGGEDLINHLNETGLGDNVMLIKTFAKIAEMLGEDKFRGQNTGSMGSGLTPAEIMRQIEELRARPGWDTDKTVKNKLTDLYQQLYP